jgi:putative PIN family toxin of toxin-antitoxin system
LIVVLDTNVWASALVFGKTYSVPARALKRAVRDDTLATSRELRAEIHRILIDKGYWSPHRATQELDTYLAKAITVQLTHTTHVCRDPKDNMFLECAALAHADLIVAGDKDLLILGSYASARIVAQFEYVSLES